MLAVVIQQGIIYNDCMDEKLKDKEMKLAVLIDADNIPYKSIKGILEELARYGIPTVKRGYGDWSRPNLAHWKPTLLENAIMPIQQYDYTVGKNATDSALIIDAMDLLYQGNTDGFCLVSSDSDFTRLATRLREAGKWVVGIGEMKTPQPFIVACDKFIYIEAIETTDIKESSEKLRKLSDIKRKKLTRLLRTTVEDCAGEDGYAFLGDVGNLLIKKQPDFDTRNYGYGKLSPLLKDLQVFDIDERRSGNSNIKHVYIRNKEQS